MLRLFLWQMQNQIPESGLSPETHRALSFLAANIKKKWEDSFPVSLLKFIFAKWPDKYREGSREWHTGYVQETSL